MTPKTITVIAIAVVAAVVILQNLGSAELHILFISIRMPVAILCLAMFLLGVLAGTLLVRRRAG